MIDESFNGSKLIRVSFLLCCWFFGSIFNSAALANTSGSATMTRDGNWIFFKGRHVLLVGDSVTQGWMELGTNFVQYAYVDALASRGINVLLLWSFIGVIDQRGDDRIGYDAPELWPWVRIHREPEAVPRGGRGSSWPWLESLMALFRTNPGNLFDLGQLNDSYFDRLRKLIQYANAKNIVVVITIHDGWMKTRFSGHPFNALHGGPLTDRTQYVEIADYTHEMPQVFNPAWGRREKHQYFLERFCDRLIEATGDLPNVMYELFNEGEWYEQAALHEFELHFLGFFESRTIRPLMVNDDPFGVRSFRNEEAVDAISSHFPKWTEVISAKQVFDYYVARFQRRPPKPSFFTEPVPGYTGRAGTEEALMRVMWGAALGGAGVVVQNDRSFGFDPHAAMARLSEKRDAIYDLEGHCSRFLNIQVISLKAMKPHGELCSTGVCMADPGIEYIVYSQTGETLTFDLSGADGTFVGRFYNPRTGEFGSTFSVDGGSAARMFRKPDGRDWVLHLRLHSEGAAR